MQLGGPEAGIPAVVGESVQVGFFLCGEHQLGQPLGADFTAGAFDMEAVLEPEPGVDVHQEGDGVGQHVIENGALRIVGTGVCEPSLTEDRFGERGRRLGGFIG